MTESQPIQPSLDAIVDVVGRYWGYDELRPFQEEAIRAGLERRDSLVVLPTGGGKSLCYQVPAVIADRMDVVVSPLISLMKDQVDGLRTCGYPAAALHTGMSAAERVRAEKLIASGECRLLFVSPERLLSPWFMARMEGLGIGAFAVDEAHCVSHWGHDFRPEYRQLAQLKERFPGCSIHAYTATATERVRKDIIAQLQLDDPSELVGTFDRPNLVYRMVMRHDLRTQVCEVLDRHRGEATIIYCISRKDTEKLAAHLCARGHNTAFYHAGMADSARRRTQEAFTNAKLDIVVATVAFGMGIDRSDVRCVIHAALPKSVEHYQQESGRAGRDGLEAECVLLHSPADFMRWKSLLERSADEEGTPPDVVQSVVALLNEMRRLCAPGRCRHQALTEYFGQAYSRPPESTGCAACDVCLGECEALEDGTTPAQIILSCVARVEQGFGLMHVVDVLRGADTERIRLLRHDELSTYGLMREDPKPVVTNRVHQLLDQEILVRTPGEYPVLRLNQASWEVLRGKRDVRLLPVSQKKKRRTAAVERESWEGVDRDLFERLRELRTRLARERGVPPYVIFGDASLRDMAASRPANEEEFLAVHGVGQKKLADLGEAFLTEIAEHTR